MSDTVKSLQALVAWAKDGGAVIDPGIEFREVSQGNIGAVWVPDSSDTNGKAELLDGNHLRLPISLAVTLKRAVEKFNQTQTCEFSEIAAKASNVNSLLILFLARERAAPYLSESNFRPYLELLPNLKQMNSPYLWNAEDKSYIKGTNLGNSLKENMTALIEEWWQLINLLPQDLAKPTAHFVNMKFYYEQKFYTDDDFYDYLVNNEDADNWTSFPNYLWGSLILKSRSFPAYLIKHIDKDADVKLDEAILLPLIDLLNHDPTAKVEWSVSQTGMTTFFNFKSDALVSSQQIMNNYGRKGNEELLLAYGFCLENNSADTACLKIKVPLEILKDVEKQGVKLPSLDDYTTSVVRTEPSCEMVANYEKYKNGLLFFITADSIPENLIQLFQLLVRNNWEEGFSLRNKLAGINQLRNAIEQKLTIINDLKSNSNSTFNARNINIYVTSQKNIFTFAIKQLKRVEKDILGNPENKPKLLSLKKVYKNDVKFNQALLVGLGVKSFENLVESKFEDQAWLLYLIRCQNRAKYQDEGENFLPEWIASAFERLKKEYSITPEEVLQYKDLYEQLIIPFNKAVPEIFDRGDWTVEQLIIAARLLDTIGFVRAPLVSALSTEALSVLMSEPPPVKACKKPGADLKGLFKSPVAGVPNKWIFTMLDSKAPLIPEILCMTKGLVNFMYKCMNPIMAKPWKTPLIWESTCFMSYSLTVVTTALGSVAPDMGLAGSTYFKVVKSFFLAITILVIRKTARVKDWRPMYAAATQNNTSGFSRSNLLETCIMISMMAILVTAGFMAIKNICRNETK